MATIQINNEILTFNNAHYVSEFGSDDNNGSINSPYFTIQKAIDVSVDNDAIVLLTNITPNRYLDITKSISFFWT